jgi:hypothetical protein
MHVQQESVLQLLAFRLVLVFWVALELEAPAGSDGMTSNDTPSTETIHSAYTHPHTRVLQLQYDGV